jgi:hypothetical protein
VVPRTSVSKRPALEKPTIGWREWVGLPELNIGRIKAKVDTGARTSALHAVDLEEFERDGCLWVRFSVHAAQRTRTPTVSVEARVLEHRSVKSSSGASQVRPVIITPVTILGQTHSIELTLTARDAMGFRMLLGREAVRNRFLIDSGRSYFGEVRD